MKKERMGILELQMTMRICCRLKARDLIRQSHRWKCSFLSGKVTKREHHEKLGFDA